MSEINKKVDSIRKSFATEMDDGENTVEQSFLEEVNGLIQLIFKDEPMDIYTALSKEELEKWKKRKFRRKLRAVWSKLNLKKSLYFLFMVTITAFLVSEAVHFYAVDGVITAKTWIKAILTEISFLFLSGFIAVGWQQKIGVSFLRVSIFTLMLFVITSEVAMQGTGTIAEIDNIGAQIEAVEKEIKDNDKLIDFYLKKNWPVRVALLQEKKAKLVDKLLKLKERQNNGKSKEVSVLVEYKLYAKAAFRVILLFISVLITRRLFKF